ncbi:MAG: oligosaccharide flippase family protein [Candidatus Micrarchaeota archaeon]|nr:oligosaccharide flippase family protein [Candidatus Micrarchaeota archaeon]
MIAQTKYRSIGELGVHTAHSGSIFMASKIAGGVVAVLLLVVTARLLQPIDYGIFSVVIAFANMLDIGGNFGIGTAVRQRLPDAMRHHPERVAPIILSGFYIVGTIALIIALAGIILSGVIANSVYHNQSMAVPIIIASASVITTVLLNLMIIVLVSIDRVNQGSVVNLLYNVLMLIATPALILAGYGVIGAVAAMIIGMGLGLLVGLYYLLKSVKFKAMGPDMKVSRDLAGYSVPVVVSHVAVNGAQNFAVLMLGVFAASVLVGNYGAAFKMGRFGDLFITSIGYVLLPAFTRVFADKNLAKRISDAFNTSLFYMVMFLVPIVTFGIASAIPLMRLLVGGTYSLAGGYFAVMAFGTIINVFGGIAGFIILGYGNSKRFMIYQLAVVAIQLVLLALLVPSMQAVGALLALFVISPFAQAIIYIYALERQFTISVDYAQLAKLALSGIMVWAVTYAIGIAMHESLASLAANLVVTILLYPPVLVYTKAVSKSNVEFVRRVQDRMKRVGFLAEYLVRYFELFMRA